MKRRNIKDNINMTVSNLVPDVLDNIVEKCEMKRGFNNMKKSKTVIKNKKSNNLFLTPKFVGVCMVVLVLGMAGLLGINQYNSQFKVFSIIEFDINPSIELKVNKDEDVIDAIALNDGAKIVLKDMDLKDVDLDVAVNAIIGSMMKNGYLTIDKNSILVSVNNKDKKESERLQKELTEEINELLKASKIDGSVLTQEFEEDENLEKLAKEYGISEGKAKLINNVLAAGLKNTKGELYTFEQLKDLSINELKVLLEEKKATVSNVNTSGTASQSTYIGKEKAKSIAFKDAGTTATKAKEVEVQLDAEYGQMIYEVEFRVGTKEYEYDINAKTGKIIFKEVDTDNDRDDDFSNKKPSTNTSTTNKNNTSTTTYIGKEKAKSIAFKNAGVSVSQVKELEVEFDKDDGVYSYEIDFKYNGMEYSYDINAKTGKIIEKDVERD